jgi:hypothetical protein
VQRILYERDVCARLRERLDSVRDDERPHDPRRLRDHLKRTMPREDAAFLAGAAGRPGWLDKLGYWLRFARLLLFAGIAVYAILFLPAVGVPAALALTLAIALVRNDEQAHADALARAAAAETDTVAAADEQKHFRELEANEDCCPQNELTAVAPLRPGRLRLALLHAVLWAVHQRANFQFTRGLLQGVPTIHFAHWLVFDGGRRLLFVSHYDGSFASYLDDFVANAAMALNAIWGGCVGFPPARYLVFEGARNAPGFKAFARQRQHGAAWFYSAYPQLSAEEINRNSERSATRRASGSRASEPGRARWDPRSRSRTSRACC